MLKAKRKPLLPPLKESYNHKICNRNTCRTTPLYSTTSAQSPLVIGPGMRAKWMFADAGAKRPPNSTGLWSLCGKSACASIFFTSFVTGKLDPFASSFKAQIIAVVNDRSPELLVRCLDSHAPRHWKILLLFSSPSCADLQSSPAQQQSNMTSTSDEVATRVRSTSCHSMLAAIIASWSIIGLPLRVR